MMRSMFAAVSGIRNHQTRMDVIGNNIANVNTVGFKYGRVTFQEALTQTIRGASAPTSDGRSGQNPMQVGLGSMLRGIDTVFTQGNPEYTGKLTDMAIQGAGFFVVSNGIDMLFSRDGAFEIGADGSLINPATGYRLQGWMADSSGRIDTSKPVGDIKLLLGQTMTAKATDTIVYRGNLNATEAVWDPATGTGGYANASTMIYDSLGVSHDVVITFTKNSANTWDWSATADGVAVGGGQVVFSSQGKVISQTGQISINHTNGADTPQIIAPDFADMTQYGQESSVDDADQNGFSAGSLDTFSIDDHGVIIGVYSNGQNEILGQVVLANFSNPGGLAKMGNNLYAETPNSGSAQIGEPGKSGKGTILSATLEMSNVDLAREFTDMIITQRGFQANSRVITASDELLQDLISLKR